MTQTGEPYLDGNLMISYNGQEVVAAFVNESGYVPTDYNDGVISVSCPIFDQWQTDGLYRLRIYGTDAQGGNFYTLYSKKLYKSEINTPDVDAINFSFKRSNFPPLSAARIYIELTAL